MAAAAIALTAAPAGAQPALVSATDRAFLANLAQANAGEIAAAALAQQRGSTPTVRVLGKTFSDDRQANQQQLAALAQSLNLALPVRPTAVAQRTLQRLASLHGTAFDTAYLAIERSDNLRNIGACQAAMTASANPAVVAFAKASLPDAGMRAAATAPVNAASQPDATGATTSVSSPAINTAPATGAGQTSGAGTPTSPDDGTGSAAGSPAGPGR